MYDYLIIGNGIAGLSATEEIRKKDSNASILIITEEKSSTYWRTRLSHLISQDFDKDDLFVKKQAWYDDRKIDQMFDSCVDKVDLKKNVILLCDGEEIEYGKVLLATGARPFIPPITNIDSKGVFAIRTMDDLMNFKEYVSDKEKALVIGGGILGLEAAHAALLLDKDVTVIESFDYLLSRQLDQDLSLKLEKSLNDMGIKTYTGKFTQEILAEDGIAKGIKLADGTEIPADVIMVQAGIRSNIDIAKNSGLDVDRGIIVDDNLKTKYDNVYAAGDCAQIGDFTIGLWTSSMEMGKIAGNNMVGDKQIYEKPKPFSLLTIGDIKLFSAGMNSGEGIEEVKAEKDGNIYKLFKLDDKFVGGILWGDIKYQNDIKEIVFNSKDLKDTKLGDIFA